MNADDANVLGITGTNTLGTNLFTYSNNNPINTVDETGYFGTPLQWACALIGGIAGWFFGDYVARKIGLSPNAGWLNWRTYAYWAVRGLVVVGGAILGYVAGTVLLKIIKGFLYTNPRVLAKLPFFVKWFLGMTGGTVVVGETMSRVIYVAQKIGAEVYKGFKYYDKIKKMFGENIANILGKADNALWLINKMSQQYKIVNIGIDLSRAQRSSSYLLEQIIIWLTKYKNVVTLFFK